MRRSSVEMRVVVCERVIVFCLERGVVQSIEKRQKEGII